MEKTPSLYIENQVYKQACKLFIQTCILLPATQGSSKHILMYTSLSASEEKQ